MKSTNDVKKDKRKRTICEELLNGLLKKKLQEENKFSVTKSGRVRHASIFVAQMNYLCQHCGQKCSKSCGNSTYITNKR